MRKRSKGIAILGWYYIIYCSIGVLISLGSIGIIAYGSYVLGNTPETAQEKLSEELLNLQHLVAQSSNNLKDYIGSTIVSMVGIVVGIGLLRLKKKAWVFVYFISIFHIFRSLYFLFLHKGAKSPVEAMITLVMSLIFIYFISHPKVAEQFE